jgi:CRP-like cAMP-binding protein/di/tricarboxylate transporter
MAERESDWGEASHSARAEESAAALALTPLFWNLDRLELARLAGELEELSFAAGDTVVVEGATGDAYFVVKSGSAWVVVGQGEKRVRLNRLGPGEGFGEMALLVGESRSASVIAESDLVVWRLPADRFRAHFEEEPSVAFQIARTLSQELAAKSSEAAELRRAGAELAVLAVKGLPREAERLLPWIARLPAWPTAALAAACRKTRQTRALHTLQESGLLRESGGRTVVHPLLVGVAAPGPATAAAGEAAWLESAAQALDAAGAPELAERLRRPQSVDPATSLTGADSLDPGFGAASWPEFPNQENPAPAGATPGAWHSGFDPGNIVHGLTARLASRRLEGATAAIALVALGVLLPTPPGLDRLALVALAIVLAAVPLQVLGVLPDYAVALALGGGLLIAGVPGVLGGFATSSWLMIVLLFATSAAVARSGLLYRVALLVLGRLPANFLSQTLSLGALGVLLSSCIPNGTPRVSLAAPAARAMHEALRLGARSPGSAALGMIVFLAFGELTTLFLTGSTVGLLLHGLMPPAAQAQLTWGGWFVAALVPNALFALLSLAAILLVLRPPLRISVDRPTIEVQRLLLGPLTREEKAGAGALLALAIGFGTQPYHRLDPALIALAAFLLLVPLGGLGADLFRAGVNWGLVVYLGLFLGLGSAFARLGIDRWFADASSGALAGAVANPYLFVLAIGIAAAALHFVVPWGTASPLLALATIPLAQAAGYHPFVPVMAVLLAGDHTFLPYMNSAYLTMYFATDGELFDHRQVQVVRWLGLLFRLAALLVSVPYWRSLGLLA